MSINNKLYNMILPPYLLMVFVPWLALLSLVGNFIIDSIVLIVVMIVVYKRIDLRFYKKNVLILWLLGFLADFVGVAYLFVIYSLSGIYGYFVEEQNKGFIHELMLGMRTVMSYSEYSNGYTICFLVSAVLISSFMIFLFDFFAVFRSVEMTKKQKIMSALSFAIFTAPYTFLLPSNLFY